MRRGSLAFSPKPRGGAAAAAAAGGTGGGGGKVGEKYD